jgi:ATP-dependent DNA ligase
VVLDEAGVSSFASLQEALSLKKRTERLVYFAFDVLHLDGWDMRGFAASGGAARDAGSPKSVNMMG